MDLVLSIVAVAEGCDPGNNRDIWAVLGLLLDCTLALDLCWKSCVLQVFGYTKYPMFQCIYLWRCLYGINDSYLNILPEFDRGICIVSLFSERGARWGER